MVKFLHILFSGWNRRTHGGVRLRAFAAVRIYHESVIRWPIIKILSRISVGGISMVSVCRRL
jgi:hypothetical protein